MLRILGHSSTACDGLSRRDLLRAGSLAALTAALPRSARASGGAGPPARAVILIDLFGGPSHIDTFDPKPAAPPEVRGEFGTIPTALPGVRFCEHLPELARRADRFCTIRTLSHGYNSHNPYAVMTGYTGGQDQVDYYSKPTNHPSIPSICQYFGVGRGTQMPGYVMLPAFPGYSQGLRRAGPYGGYLGSAFDPVFSTCAPKWSREVNADRDFYDHTLQAMGEPDLPKPEGTITLDALDRRRTLVSQIDAQAAQVAGTRGMVDSRRRAFELLMSPGARRAFDVGREAPAARDRYGRDLFGSSVLLARRLVESGVTFVTVHTEAKASGHWDTHSNNFKMLKHLLLPFLDRAVSALIDDLRDRGLLDSTLVMVQGDMGRTPRVNAAAGRDHWPQCGFCLLVGGGIKEGCVHGKSDKSAAYPVDHPVTPGDLAATVYHLVGVDPEGTVPDHTTRPIPISHGGRVVTEILTRPS
ncbi:DUF1501 domain-containing protein [Fimbriiglobus ruber]|uniref:DUF1501 domain-containing protein n=1 Tax=Fimbriiglobus ruber TaxID=1908690 RepID=A0A225DXP9_9BACT|nr:DUF1501 domain-containing protein [Fimbriiglobus ruber]OWK44354.1 hypothetical protein FRUB_02286 [Fimbriiglobus ruber]